MSIKKGKFDPADPIATEDPSPEGLRVVKGLAILPRSRTPGVSKYDIASLEVGDAFVSTKQADIRNVAVAARAYAKRNGGDVKFATRKTQDGKYALQRVA
jgi:hypothetical protein